MIFAELRQIRMGNGSAWFYKLTYLLLIGFFLVVLPWIIPGWVLAYRRFDVATIYESSKWTWPALFATLDLTVFGLVLPIVSKKIRTIMICRPHRTALAAFGSMGYLATWIALSGGALEDTTPDGAVWLCLAFAAPALAIGRTRSVKGEHKGRCKESKSPSEDLLGKSV